MKRPTVLFIASGKYVGLPFNFTRLAIALEEAGPRVVVVSEPKEEEKNLREELIQRGIKHYAFGGLHDLSVKNTIGAARTLARIVDFENVDVIHAQGIRELIVAFIASRIFFHRKKPPIVLSVHSLLRGSSYENLTPLIASFLLNVCADLALPVAKSVADNLVDFGAIPNKMVIVYNGIDLDLMDEIMNDDEDLSELANVLNDSPAIVVGYFARMDNFKGHKYLIEAISEVSKSIPNIKLILAGDGPYKNSMENLSRRLGIEKKVLFPGKISHKSVYKLLKRVNIYAFPSLGELFPFAILEAMAAGKPIVATNVGGVGEVIKNEENGLLVSPRSSYELAEGIKLLASNPVEAEEMGKKCRNLIEAKFTVQKVAHDLTGCYKLILQRKYQNN